MQNMRKILLQRTSYPCTAAWKNAKRKIHSSFGLENTTYKSMVQQWAQKWQSSLPIFSWLGFKQKSQTKAHLKPLNWKRYIDGMFSHWTLNREEIMQFIEQAQKQHYTIKFTAEISYRETTFLDTSIYKGERFRSNSGLNVRTHFLTYWTFQYAHSSSCHPLRVKKGFIKGEALRLLRTN